MRAQGHAFSQTGYNKRVCDGEESEVLRECQILCVEEDDRLVRERRKAGVDARYEVRNSTLYLVLLRSRECHLNEHHLP